MTTFVKEGETNPETNHGQIFINYKEKGGMFMDFVAWFPNLAIFFLDCSKANLYRCLYFWYSVRILKASEKFDIVTIM